jgi:hypothetical protein
LEFECGIETEFTTDRELFGALLFKYFSMFASLPLVQGHFGQTIIPDKSIMSAVFHLLSKMKSNSILANARNRSTIGFALSLLFHIAILLFALEHQSTPPQEIGTSMTAPLSIRLLPPSEGSSKAPPTAAITVTPQTQKMPGQPKEQART